MRPAELSRRLLRMFFDRLKNMVRPRPSPAAASPTPGQRGDPIIAFVLFATPDPFSSDLTNAVANAKLNRARPTDVQTSNETISFNLGDDIGTIAHMPVPVPARDLESALAATWMLPPTASRDDIRNHSSHAIVAFAGGSAPHIDRLLALTQLTAIAASRPDTLAVIWGAANLLVFPPVFCQLAAAATSPDAPPIFLWVNFRAGQNPDGTHHCVTQGLPALGHMDIEIPSTSCSPGELREWLPNIILYLLEKGPVLLPGQTIGPDANTRFKIRHQPSSFGLPGTFISLS